jgi:hypothetical protein
MKNLRLELSSEQTLHLQELRDALAAALPPDAAEGVEFPVSYNACGCGCTTSYYYTCATACYGGCVGTCSGTCKLFCGTNCLVTCYTSMCRTTEMV